MAEYVELKAGEDIMRVARANNKWLGAIDIIATAPVQVTIKKLFKFKDAEFEGGRKASGWALEFEKGTKAMIINSTNATTLYTKYGKTPEELIGKTITLVVEKLKREFNGKTHGVRIQ
jgi:uncharacterized membrane protein YvbJ